MIKLVIAAAALWGQSALAAESVTSLEPLYTTSFEQVMLRNMCTNESTRVLALSITNLKWTVTIDVKSNCTYRAVEELELADHWTKHYTILPFAVNDEYVLRWRWRAPADGRVVLRATRVARPHAFLIITKEEE